MKTTHRDASPQRHVPATLLAAILVAASAAVLPAVPVNFSYTQTDASTGAGTITGSLDTTFAGGPGVLPFSGALPAAAINQKDATAEPVPGTMVGFITGSSAANPGTSIGVHLGWSGMVSISAISGPDTYAVDVPLIVPVGTPYSYTIGLTDDNSVVAGTNDAVGSNGDMQSQVRGWIGDDGGGHRHTGPNLVFAAGVDTHAPSQSFNTGGGTSGDDLGITVGMEAPFTGTIFVDDVTLTGTLDADLLSMTVNGSPPPLPPAPNSGLPFDINVDIGPAGQDVAGSDVGVTGPAANTNGVDLLPTNVSTGTGTFQVSIDDTDTLGNDVGGIDWRDRGNSPNSANPLVDLGEDFVKNNGGIVRVTLENLPIGFYDLTSYHLDPPNTQSDQIEISIDTGSGFVSTGAVGDAGFNPGTGGFDTADVTATQASISFIANGIDPVVLVFDGRPSGDNETPLNGFRLTFTPTPEPSTGLVLAAALSLMALRRRRRG